MPWFLSRKSPKARDIARPGESSLGSHTRWMWGSSFNANTRPLHFLILSASPELHINNCQSSLNNKIPLRNVRLIKGVSKTVQ